MISATTTVIIFITPNYIFGNEPDVEFVSPRSPLPEEESQRT